jgi:hypothetical protein
MSQLWAVYSIEQSEFVQEMICRCNKAGVKNVSSSIVSENIHYKVYGMRDRQVKAMYEC